MEPTQELRRMGRADVMELNNLLRKALNAVFGHAAALINALEECRGGECIDSINAVINDLTADAQYLMGMINNREYELSMVMNFVRAMHELLKYLAGFGLLNTDYAEFLNEVLIRDTDDMPTSASKAWALINNVGRVLTHAACMARHRGLGRVDGYVIDKALLLLGMAMDDAVHGKGKRFPYIFASAFLTFYGKDAEASNALAKAGFDYGRLDDFLNFCAALARLYELGIRFTESDYS